MKVRSSEPTKEDTLNALLKKLHEKRCSAGRPEELEVYLKCLQCYQKVVTSGDCIQF